MGGWGRGMGRKVIWHAHGWFFLYVNVVSPWLMFSPSVIVLEVNVSIAVNLFRSLFSCLPSCCQSLFCSSCFCFFVSVLLTSAPAEHQSLFCLFGVFLKLSGSRHQCLSLSSLTTETNHHWGSMHSSHLDANQPCQWLLNRQNMLLTTAVEKQE